MINPIQLLYRYYYKYFHLYKFNDLEHITKNIEIKFSYFERQEFHLFNRYILHIKLEGSHLIESDYSNRAIFHITSIEGIVTLTINTHSIVHIMPRRYPSEIYLDDVRKYLYKNVKLNPNKVLEDYISILIVKYFI